MPSGIITALLSHMVACWSVQCQPSSATYSPLSLACVVGLLRLLLCQSFNPLLCQSFNAHEAEINWIDVHPDGKPDDEPNNPHELHVFFFILMAKLISSFHPMIFICLSFGKTDRRSS